jgi:anti-sigma-K factor RskA
MGRDYRASSAVLRAVLALAAIAATLMWGRLAHADAAPVQLILLYMPAVSNTGSTTATGVAELVMSEGEVRIKAADLPRLDGDKRYVVWVVNSTTNEFRRLGAFNTAASTGAIDYETVEPDAIPDKSWNLLLVTIEDSATPDAPSNQHSIAGVFPSADNAPLPVVLPNTGGAPDVPYRPSQANRPEWLGMAVLGMLVTFGAGYGLGLKRR